MHQVEVKMAQLDRIEKMLQTLLPREGNLSEHETIKATTAPKWFMSFVGALIGDCKIDAIRAHRMLTGMGLKESDDEVERIYTYMKDRK